MNKKLIDIDVLRQSMKSLQVHENEYCQWTIEKVLEKITELTELSELGTPLLFPFDFEVGDEVCNRDSFERGVITGGSSNNYYVKFFNSDKETKVYGSSLKLVERVKKRGFFEREIKEISEKLDEIRDITSSAPISSIDEILLVINNLEIPGSNDDFGIGFRAALLAVNLAINELAIKK